MLNIYFKNRVLYVIEESEAEEIPDGPVLDVYGKPEEISQALEDFDRFKSIKQAVLVVGSYLEFFNEVKTNIKYIKAAGGIVSNSKNEVLVMYRLNTWDLPKGKIDKGENAKEAAAREIEEECGISNLQIGSELIPTYHTYRLKEKLVLKKTFWYKVRFEGEEKLVPQTEENISELKWIGKEQYKEVLVNTYPSIVDVFTQIGWNAPETAEEES